MALDQSSTLRSESENRTYIITASRMSSGLVLKWRNGECFVIRRGYKVALPASSKFTLTTAFERQLSLPLLNKHVDTLGRVIRETSLIPRWIKGLDIAIRIACATSQNIFP